VTQTIDLEKISQLISRVASETNPEEINSPELVDAIDSVLKVLEKNHSDNPFVKNALADARKAIEKS
jgi:hypothetical protein